MSQTAAQLADKLQCFLTLVLLNLQAIIKAALRYNVHIHNSLVALAAHVLRLAHRIALRVCAHLDPTEPVQSSGAAPLLPS